LRQPPLPHRLLPEPPAHITPAISLSCRVALSPKPSHQVIGLLPRHPPQASPRRPRRYVHYTFRLRLAEQLLRSRRPGQKGLSRAADSSRSRAAVFTPPSQAAQCLAPQPQSPAPSSPATRLSFIFSLVNASNYVAFAHGNARYCPVTRPGGVSLTNSPCVLPPIGSFLGRMLARHARARY